MDCIRLAKEESEMINRINEVHEATMVQKLIVENKKKVQELKEYLKLEDIEGIDKHKAAAMRKSLNTAGEFLSESGNIIANLQMIIWDRNEPNKSHEVYVSQITFTQGLDHMSAEK